MKQPCTSKLYSTYNAMLNPLSCRCVSWWSTALMKEGLAVDTHQSCRLLEDVSKPIHLQFVLTCGSILARMCAHSGLDWIILDKARMTGKRKILPNQATFKVTLTSLSKVGMNCYSRDCAPALYKLYSPIYTDHSWALSTSIRQIELYSGLQLVLLYVVIYSFRVPVAASTSRYNQGLPNVENC